MHLIRAQEWRGALQHFRTHCQVLPFVARPPSEVRQHPLEPFEVGATYIMVPFRPQHETDLHLWKLTNKGMQVGTQALLRLAQGEHAVRGQPVVVTCCHREPRDVWIFVLPGSAAVSFYNRSWGRQPPEGSEPMPPVTAKPPPPQQHFSFLATVPPEQPLGAPLMVGHRAPSQAAHPGGGGVTVVEEKGVGKYFKQIDGRAVFDMR